MHFRCTDAYRSPRVLMRHARSTMRCEPPLNECSKHSHCRRRFVNCAATPTARPSSKASFRTSARVDTMRRVAARVPHERAMVRVTLIACSLLVLAGCADEDAPPPPRVSGADVYLRPDTTAIRGIVPNRSTMDSMLRAHGLDASAVEEVVAAARAVFDPRRLRSLQPFLLERTLDGALRLFEYEIDNDSFLRITKTPDATSGARAEVLPIPKTLETVSASGEIGEATPSLFQSIEAAGEGVDLAIA